MKFGVVVFPFSTSHEDIIFSFEKFLDQKVEIIWHKEAKFPKVDAIFIPSCHNYDEAMDSPVVSKIVEFANKGGFVIGISGGFEFLCNIGLLPGKLLENSSGRFLCKNIYVRGESRKSPFNSRELFLPIAHKKGRYTAEESVLKKLNENEQVLFRYCDQNGSVSANVNPNGSAQNIAGICNEKRNVYGFMPHPERAADDELGNTDGKIVLQNIIEMVSK
jgi:phosphoribosylformylglycinamidine synthase